MPRYPRRCLRGLADDPMAKVHLGSRLRNLPEESLTEGPHGEEVPVSGVRTFPSGSIVRLFGVWPGHGRHVYAIVVDEKFPCSLASIIARYQIYGAELTWERLVRYEDARNEALGSALVEDGWTQLVPQHNRVYFVLDNRDSRPRSPVG